MLNLALRFKVYVDAVDFAFRTENSTTEKLDK